MTSMRQRLLLFGPYVLLVVVIFFGLRAYEHEQSSRITAVTQDRTEARFRDCHAYDDVGNAIKAGISVLTEQMAAEEPTAEQQARLNAFIAKYTNAVDGAITRAKVNKGYAADCSRVGN